MSRLVIPQLRVRKKGRDLIREDGARVKPVTNENTGNRGGIVVEHKSGRVDSHVRPDPVRPKFDQVGMSMSHYQRRQYELLRQQGLSHEMALLKTPTPLRKRVF